MVSNVGIKGLILSGGREMEVHTLKTMKVRGDEDWKAAVMRLVLMFRSTLVDPVPPHISEASFSWKYISEQQFVELIERVLQLLLPSIDQADLQSLMHVQIVRIQEQVLPLLV